MIGEMCGRYNEEATFAFMFKYLRNKQVGKRTRYRSPIGVVERG